MIWRMAQLLFLSMMLVMGQATHVFSATLCGVTVESLPKSDNLLLGSIIHVNADEGDDLIISHLEFANHDLSSDLFLLVDWKFKHSDDTESGSYAIRLMQRHCERGQMNLIRLHMNLIRLHKLAGTGTLFLKLTLKEVAAGNVRYSNTQHLLLFSPE